MPPNDSMITITTEQTTNATAMVIMINIKKLIATIAATDPTSSVLRVKDVVVVLFSKSIGSLDVCPSCLK